MLDERKLQILSWIVNAHVRTGEPVGSKLVAELMGSSFSPATIRNDMAVLFDMGLLEQPHTSAGRVPSHLGYRLFIDRLMQPRDLGGESRDSIDAMFNVRNPDPELLLKDAAQALAALTGCATISSTITPPTVTVRRVDIIPVGQRTVCILMIASNGMIKNKVCRVDFVVTPEIIEFFSRFASSRVVGKTLEELSLLYLNSVAISLGEYSRIFTPILAAIYELASEIYGEQCYTAGLGNLFDYPELRAFAPELLSFLSEKDGVLELIKGGDSRITKVTVGRENQRSELCDVSVIVKKYDIGDHTTGAIGLLGPVRMDYAGAISYVEYFAQMMAALLSETYEEQ